MRRLALYIATIFVCFFANAQEYQFSQFYTASLYLNPAFAGIYTSPTLNANYRQITTSVDLQQQMAQVSFVMPILVQGSESRQLGGVGLSGYTNQAGIQGVERISGFTLTYAHTQKLAMVSPDVLSLGIQAGYETVDVSYSGLNWGSQYSPFLGSGFDETSPSPVTDYDVRTSHLIVNAGVMYYYNRNRNYLLYNYSAFSGISVSNVNRPDKSFNKDGGYVAPLLYKYHGAFEFNVNKFYVIPAAYVQYHSANWQFNTGTYITYMTNASKGFSLDQRGLELVGGVWYRVRDSFIVILGVNHDNYSINVSYDFNSTLFFPEAVDLNGLVQPAFEISLRYSRSKDSRMRKVSNPLF